MLAACSEQEVLSMKQADWEIFKKRFVTSQGRIMDEVQNHATHSEGQAYAMLLAVAFNDRQSFDQYWQWSRKHLQVREHDHLLAWLWDSENQKIADINNATDGDLITAWALVRAAKRWGVSTYAEDAKEILVDLRALEVNIGEYLLLLPGKKGFIHPTGATINPSYFVFPAYQELAIFDSDGHWQRLEYDAMKLLQQARFGVWRLPPDWLDVSGSSITLSEEKPAWFSYDAIRIPLYAVWAGKAVSTHEFRAFWQQFEALESVVPDRVDLETDFIHFDDIFRAGKAIHQLCTYSLDQTGKSSAWPTLHWLDNTTYFDASLTLLSQLAWLEVSAQKTLQEPIQGVVQ